MAVQPLSPANDRRLGEPLPHQLSNRTRAHLSAIKSLVYRPCDPYTLCGISSRFQLLSPTERQVAHALLTRPPLSYLKSIRKLHSNNSVRLACVRHAASVRPEPGSNSLKIVSKQPLGCSNHFQSFVSSFDAMRLDELSSSLFVTLKVRFYFLI